MIWLNVVSYSGIVTAFITFQAVASRIPYGENRVIESWISREEIV